VKPSFPIATRCELSFLRDTIEYCKSTSNKGSGTEWVQGNAFSWPVRISCLTLSIKRWHKSSKAFAHTVPIFRKHLEKFVGTIARKGETQKCYSVKRKALPV